MKQLHCKAGWVSVSQSGQTPWSWTRTHPQALRMGSWGRTPRRGKAGQGRAGRYAEGRAEGLKAEAVGPDSFSSSVSRADARHREKGRVWSIS